jgi:large subunit ribosomal protein L10
MAKSRAQKNESLVELKELFKSGKSIMFADYQGMTVAKMTSLRKQLTGAKVDYVVAKKTLLGIAAKEAGYEVDFSKVPGMVGAAFAHEDEMAPAKIIGDAGKEAPIKLVGGIFDGKAVDATYAIALSKLPSKQALLGQFLSVLNAPSSAFVRVLNAHKEKQEGGAAAA